MSFPLHSKVCVTWICVSVIQTQLVTCVLSNMAYNAVGQGLLFTVSH